VPALARTLASDPEPLVRGHAAWALGQLGGEQARQALIEVLEGEQDAEVQQEVRCALESGKGWNG
jgi:epoxyqueuosine reductase